MKLRDGISKGLFYRGVQFFAAILCGYFVCYSITDSDIFWHLAAGREIIGRHALLYRDPFSYSTPDTPWINLHWLFQVVMYLLQKAGGFTLLIAVKGMAVACAAWLTFAAFPPTAATAAAALGAATVFFGQRYLIPLRPIIATLMLMGLFIASFEKYCRGGPIRSLLPVLIGQVVWVNCQGLFALGWIIAGAYGAGESIGLWCARRFPQRLIPYPGSTPLRCRTLLVCTPALVVLSLVNPYGWKAIGFAIRLFVRINPAISRLYSKTITENMPLIDMIGTVYFGHVVIITLIAGATLISMIMAPRAFRFSHAAMATAGMLLALTAQRNGILFTFLALPALFWNISHMSITMSQRVAGTLRNTALITTALLALLSVINHTRILLLWPHTISPFSYPTETAAVLERNPIPGKIFNADRYGGYLIWRLFPSLKVSHDTRWTLRSHDSFIEYLALAENPLFFREYALKSGITHVILPLAPIDRYLKLAAALYRDPDWKMAFTDGTEVLFVIDTISGFKGMVLDSISEIESIAESLKRRFERSPQVYKESLVWLGRWCTEAGAQACAGKIFLDPDRQKENSR